MIANALSENKNLRLSNFSAGRDRLENKGITALAGVFKAMGGSLEVIEVPQNGIKKDGMIALMEALKANSDSLREVHLHDNWIKGEAIDRLVEFVVRAKKLEILNVSDSTMGTEAALLLVTALSQSESTIRTTLKHFSCNYNEVESPTVSKRILDILLSDAFTALDIVEYKGNAIGRKAAQGYLKKFEERGRKLLIFDEDEDEEDVDEEEEEEEDIEGINEEDLMKKLEALKL